MMLTTFLCLLAGFFLFAHLWTLATAWWRCRPQRVPDAGSRPSPGITVVRPLCGLETFSAETLDGAFSIDYPAFELIFCVARADDPIVPLVQAAIARHPDVPARLLVGDDVISVNPKLNNMVKGWRQARYEWIAFIDSNVLIARDVLHRLVDAWRPDTGCVAAPPLGLGPSDFGGHFECAFLNTYEARWQYFVDTFGSGFAQGKTLFYRKADLDRTNMRALAEEPAEDAATTKMVRGLGLRVRLAPPSPQPLGARSCREVWNRQLRWARLRRVTFPLEFFPEIIAGSAIPFLVTAGAAFAADLPVPLVLGAYIAIWYLAENALAIACRWPYGWQTPLAILARDAMLPALWVAAIAGSSFTWKGTAMEVEERHWLKAFKLKLQQNKPI